MTIQDHFRKHGTVHALWVIACLLLVIAWLLLRAPNGDLIGQYIGFAASVASLVLAVVAIGYAFVSNQGFSEMAGSLKSSADNVQRAAQNIAETSLTLSERAELLTGQVERVPSAVEALSAKLDEKVFQASDKRLDLVDLADSTDSLTKNVLRRSRTGAQIGLYALAKSLRYERAVDATGILGNEEGAQAWRGVLIGFSLCVQGFKPYDIDVILENIDDKHYVRATSFGKLNADEAIQFVLASDFGDGNRIRDGIDAYFDESPEESKSAEPN